MNKEDIKLARQCMDFQNIKCENKGCLNKSCPLNKVYDTQFKSKVKQVKK